MITRYSANGLLAAGLIFAFILLLPQTSAAFEDNDCRSIVPTTVDVTEEFGASDTRDTVRARATDRISHDAVAEVVGVSIRSSRSMQAQAINDQVDEKFQQRAIVQSAGLVRYKISDEKLVESPGGRSLHVQANAEVCVPKSPAVLKQVVLIGQTLSSRGEDLAEFRDAIAQIFSSSPSFVVTDETDGFHDAVITGRINEVEIRDLKSGADTSLSGKPSVLGAGQAPSDFQRIRVNLTVQAKLDDGSVVSQTLNEFRNVPQGRDPKDEITNFIVPLLKKGAKDLHEKLVANRSVGDANRTAPASGTPSKPKW